VRNKREIPAEVSGSGVFTLKPEKPWLRVEVGENREDEFGGDERRIRGSSRTRGYSGGPEASLPYREEG